MKFMKRIVSMVLTAVMFLCIMPVVFAAGNAVSVASTSSTYIGHLTNGTTLVDISTGNVVTEGGAVLSVVAEAPEAYVFTATTNGQEYEYSLLDEREVNGKKEYFILANNAYGIPGTSWVLADNTFNYGAENNLATLLNDSFYNTALAESLALDATMKGYIVENAWLTEGNHNNSDPVTQFDYTSTCKIAVLSEHEYIKYSNKIGSQVKNASGTVINNSSWYLRTARATKTDGTAPNNNIRYVVASNGNTNGDNFIKDSTKGLRFQIRPCFWISEDYFNEVTLTSAGSEVPMKNTGGDGEDEEPGGDKPEVSTVGNAISVSNTSSTYIGHLVNGTTLVDISTGNVVTEGGAVLRVAAEAPEAYVFTATTNGQEYEYSLLDEREVNGKKEYFILANNAYGIPGTSWALADNTFNYGAEKNLATFLNDEFYVTPPATDGLALDANMTRYIVENAWLTEGNHNNSNAVTQFDYTSTCKIAVLSEHEYIKYSNKIGSQVKNASGTVISNASWYLRTARASKADGTAPNNNIRYVVASNGNTNGDNYIQDSTKGLRFQIRPCFWISEDYFKNQKLSSLGSSVKEILKTSIAKNTYGGTYTDEELSSFLGYTADSAKIEKATVTGFRAVNQTVTAELNTDASEDAAITIRYEWYLDGEKVCDKKSYTIPTDAQGKALSVSISLVDTATQEQYFTKACQVGEIAAERSVTVTMPESLDVTGNTIKGTFTYKATDPVAVTLYLVAYDSNNAMLDYGKETVNATTAPDSIDVTFTGGAAAAIFRAIAVDSNNRLLLARTYSQDGTEGPTTLARGSEFTSPQFKVMQNGYAVVGKITPTNSGLLWISVMTDGGTKLVHTSSIVTDDTGCFDYRFSLGDNLSAGEYKLAVYGDGIKIYEYVLNHADTNKIVELISALTDATTVAEAETAYNTAIRYDLITYPGGKTDAWAAYWTEKHKKSLYQEIVTNSFTVENYFSKLLDLYAWVSVEYADNTSINEIINEYWSILGVEGDSKYQDLYTDENKNDIHSMIVQNKTADADELRLVVKQAIVLNLLSNTAAPQSVVTYMNTYAEVFTEVVQNLSADEKLTLAAMLIDAKEDGQKIVTMKQLEEKANMIDADTPTITPMPGGSGGGSGGGGGIHTTAGTVIPSVPSPIKVDTAIIEDRSFADLRDAQWARQAVEHLAEKQIIHGYEDGDFRPNNPITREEFVKIVMLAFEIAPSTADAGFADVSLDHWAHDYISGAKESGIISGIGNQMFGTRANITRQDMAVMLFQAIKYLQIAPEKKSIAFFTDHELISGYATEAVYALSATDSIKGYTDGSFEPQKNATRAEAAQMVYNVLVYLKQ